MVYFRKKNHMFLSIKKAASCPFYRAALTVLFFLSAASPVVRLPTMGYKQLHNVVRGEPSEAFDTFSTNFLSLKKHLDAHEEGPASSSSMHASYCSSSINRTTLLELPQDGTLCCDRSNLRSDICYMKGDIRTSSPSSSIILYNPVHHQRDEKIRPYTRKWEGEVMKTINEVHIKAINARSSSLHHRPAIKCDVNHTVPAVVFSTGGYTGNLYHEFNDGLIPLYITVERFKGEVVLLVLEFHQWWMSKYREVVKRMTNYDLVDFNTEQRVHCFKEMIVGLRIHGELAIDPSHGGTRRTIHDFQELLHESFKGWSSRQGNQLPPQPAPNHKPPMLVILVRSKSRVMLNLKETIKSCHRVGFQVQTLHPKRTTPLSEIYAALNSAQVVVGVHGAALTHFLFMRPGSVFIQIVPLGLTWPAEAYYGEPAKKLGLKYIEYRIAAEESSLWEEFRRDDAIISDPDAVNKRGWVETKRIYLAKQNVRLNQMRFLRVLEKVYLCFNHSGLDQDHRSL